jgi:hypothetical protein
MKYWLLLPLFLICGCGVQNETEREGRAASATGSGFDEERGVFLSAETRRTLDVQVGVVEERLARRRVEAVARIYAPGKAMVSVDESDVANIKLGDSVRCGKALDLVEGKIIGFANLTNAFGEVEVLVELRAEVSSSATTWTIPAVIEASTAEKRPSVPESSLLQTGEGSFVFVANDDHFRRTRVKTGATQDGWVQLTEGLHTGDVIVTNAIQRLWCIELQATKGGDACCPAPLGK